MARRRRRARRRPGQCAPSPPREWMWRSMPAAVSGIHGFGAKRSSDGAGWSVRARETSAMLWCRRRVCPTFDYIPPAVSHDLPLLINIAVALGYALVGGLIARRLRLPTIVGYLLAGVAMGPFTPGFSGDIVAIQQLAELGVILLMFGIGLHFSFDDLWLVRDIA